MYITGMNRRSSCQRKDTDKRTIKMLRCDTLPFKIEVFVTITWYIYIPVGSFIKRYHLNSISRSNSSSKANLNIWKAETIFHFLTFGISLLPTEGTTKKFQALKKQRYHQYVYVLLYSTHICDCRRKVQKITKLPLQRECFL